MMQFWNSPELYASIGAVIGTTGVVIYLTAPGRLKAKQRKLQEQPQKTRGPRGPLGELLLLDSSRGQRTVAPAARDARSERQDRQERPEKKGGRDGVRAPGNMMVGGAAPIGPVPMAAEHESTRFSDLAGLDEAITELAEVREYLSDPERFKAVGADLPRGILLFGPPGCGKTLLARALAGETGVPFYNVSAASFVEQMVGLGSARVRQLFAEARRTAPS